MKKASTYCSLFTVDIRQIDLDHRTMVDHSAENKQTKQQQQNYVILVIISLSHSNITQLEISVNVIVDVFKTKCAAIRLPSNPADNKQTMEWHRNEGIKKVYSSRSNEDIYV